MKIFKSKIFITLFFAIFAAVTGVGIVVPLLPVYAREIGASGIEIGLILGSFSLSRGLFLLYFGRMSDKNGRKPYIVAGLLSYAIISVAFIFSKNVTSITVTRFIQGIASAMIMPAVQAYVGEITPQGSEGKVMGVFNMSVFIGLSAGPLIGGIIKDKLGMNSALISMGVLSFIGLVLSYFYLPPKSEEKNRRENKPLTRWSVILNDRVIIGLVCVRIAYTTCIGIVWGFLPLFAHNEYGLSSSAIGVLVMLGVGVSGAIQTPMGWLSDKIDRKIMIVTGGGVVMVSIYTFTLSSGFWGLFYSNILFGIGGSLITPAVMAAAVVRGNKGNAMGSVMALLTMGHSVGMMLGAFIAGFMLDISELRQVFYIGPPIMLVGLIILIFCTKEDGLNQPTVKPLITSDYKY